MANSLFPSFVRINYTSLYGAHVMTIPSVAIVGGINAPSLHDFDLRGAAISVEADAAVKAFVAILKKNFIGSTTFVDYTLFTMADENATPTPVYSAALGVVGTNGSAGWTKAVQETITWRTESFGLFKLVLLDCVSDNLFNKVTALGAVGTNLRDLSDYVTASVSWLSGRDGGRPAVFLQAAWTLNEKLRRAYKLN